MPLPDQPATHVGALVLQADQPSPVNILPPAAGLDDASQQPLPQGLVCFLSMGLATLRCIQCLETGSHRPRP